MKSINKVIWLLAGAIFGFVLSNVLSEERKSPEDTAMDSGAPTEEIWTCSMHPQVRQPEPGKCPICEMDLILLETNSSDNPLEMTMSESALKLADLQTTSVRSGTGEKNDLFLAGRIQADERLAASQVAHWPGRIEKMYVSFEGEQVRKGQKLAEIYSPPLITAQTELLEALRMSEVNPDLLEAARKKLRFWKIPESTIADIEGSGQIREVFTLLADVSGTVDQRRISVGDYIQQGEILFDLQNLDRLWVVFDAYERDLPVIRTGQQISFTTEAIPGRVFEGKIDFIDPVIGEESRVAKVRTSVTNTGARLKPEMLVKGRLKTSEGKQVDRLFIPRSAVLWTGKKSVVYVRVPDRSVPTFEYREVEIAESSGESYEVLSGLEYGESVVSQGAFMLDAAAQLNNQPSMMNKFLEKEESDGADFREETPVLFREQLDALGRAYLELKDRFVLSDQSKVSEAAGLFTEKLKGVDMMLLNGEAHEHWMKVSADLAVHAKQVETESDLEAQRRQFAFLSDLLIGVYKAYGQAADTLYVKHCPMAFDDEGANWLGDEREINNPYFGDKMLRCGVVKEVLESEITSLGSN